MRYQTAACCMAALVLGALTPLAASAQAEKSKPVVGRDPSAGDVATTPLRDLNIKKGKIPAVLVRAQASPYGLSGMTSCPRIAGAVVALNGALGDDVDLAQRKGKAVTPGKVAQSVVSGLIPFGGLVREVSGANAEERRLQQAIYAGFARRAFLKGVGMQRGCKYPARPA